jgi:hypothetical protein
MAPQDQPMLPIALGLRELGHRAGVRLLKIVRELVQSNPDKQETIAKAMGISETLLSLALKGQRAFHLEWLPALLPFDHEHKILRHLAWECGCRVTPVDPFTDADYRAATETVLVDAGPLGEQLRQQILEAAQQVAQERAK